MPKLPSIPGHILSLSNPELERLERRFPGVSVNPKNCPTCHGTKSFMWYADSDPTAPVVEWECDCVDQTILHLYLLNAGIGLKYQRYCTGDIRGREDMVEVLFEWVDRLEWSLDNGMGAYLFGSVGTGKSLLATMMMKWSIQLVPGLSCHWTTFAELLANLKDGFESREDRTWFYKKVRNAKLLVIDDIGREHIKQTDERGRQLQVKNFAWAHSTLEDLIRHRIAAQAPTIITSNLYPDQLEGGYGAHLISLLSEVMVEAEVAGGDHRRPRSEESWAEYKLGIKRRPVMLT